jgi:surface antigen
MCCAAGLATSGCSLSFPISGFVTDAMPTGSIDRGSALLSKELDQEDWRRAKSAMAVALDPQGNGASVAWANPQSGAKGTFVAVAPPFPKSDQICRAFLAHLTPDPSRDRDVQGSACRGSDGDWIVADAKELKKAKI